MWAWFDFSFDLLSCTWRFGCLAWCLFVALWFIAWVCAVFAITLAYDFLFAFCGWFDLRFGNAVFCFLSFGFFILFEIV